jgi:Caspase domain
MAEKSGMNSRGIRIAKVEVKTAPEVKRSFTFDSDRYIYNDLVRRSGSIVFSSCKGGELSYENDTIKNGVFTKEIINTLSEKKTDVITTDELRDKVSSAVAKDTAGMQNPTVDRDNIYIKFDLPSVK